MVSREDIQKSTKNNVVDLQKILKLQKEYKKEKTDKLVQGRTDSSKKLNLFLSVYREFHSSEYEVHKYKRWFSYKGANGHTYRKLIKTDAARLKEFHEYIKEKYGCEDEADIKKYLIWVFNKALHRFDTVSQTRVFGLVVSLKVADIYFSDWQKKHLRSKVKKFEAVKSEYQEYFNQHEKS